jgi:ABC-type Fe3+/spermidine/putrescine transport system ATPase subunit
LEGVFSVRTIHLGLSREAPVRQANVWPVRIRRSVFQGDFTQYQVDWEDRQLVVRCTATDLLAEGEQAYLTVDPRRCVLLEAEPANA